MLSGVSIVCFAASYTVALALEVTRLLFRSGIRGAAMLGFAGAGLFAHTVFLCHRAIGASGSPLSSEQDWYLVTAWAITALYLYLTYFHSRTAFGLPGRLTIRVLPALPATPRVSIALGV